MQGTSLLEQKQSITVIYALLLDQTGISEIFRTIFLLSQTLEMGVF